MEGWVKNSSALLQVVAMSVDKNIISQSLIFFLMLANQEMY